ncbi:hypothetical protein CCZ27_00225 [Thauera sinica]|nr:hypothetical protein CCZ27_00225 [Thauera sp. K11]
MILPPAHRNAARRAPQCVGGRVRGRGRDASPQYGFAMQLDFKTTGSPAVLSPAVRGRHRS